MTEEQIVELGMPADEVLQTPGYTKRDAVRPPMRKGKDELGLIVKWFYPDVTITFTRFGEPLCYRIAELGWRLD